MQSFHGKEGEQEAEHFEPEVVGTRRAFSSLRKEFSHTVGLGKIYLERWWVLESDGWNLNSPSALEKWVNSAGYFSLQSSHSFCHASPFHRCSVS